MRAIVGTIMGRYNEIVACINADPEGLEPIFWEGPQGDLIGRPKACEPLKPPPSEAAASREAADASDATTGINTSS
jgi:hypothetical protein